MWEYRAGLVRVIDGDTYVLDIDLGFHVTVREHVRLWGIDCPEHNTAAGRAAIAFASAWWAANPLVRVQTQREKDTEVKTFDRWVAAIVPLGSGPGSAPGIDQSLAAALRAAGHVKPVEHLGRRATAPE